MRGTTKRVFVNGVLDASGPAAVPVTWAPHYVLFGADEEPAAPMVGHRVQGAMDDVMMFDRALDEVELAALAAQ